VPKQHTESVRSRVLGLRRTRGWSLTQIAAETGLPRSTIGEWLRGVGPRGGAYSYVCAECGTEFEGTAIGRQNGRRTFCEPACAMRHNGRETYKRRKQR
jgi:transcriptional regulator with XRE-family HTH domain